MDFSETIVFYLLFGAAVTVAIFLKPRTRKREERIFVLFSALFFWPFYLPLLLTRGEEVIGETHDAESEPTDSMQTMIQQVEDELEKALRSLDGWAEDVLAREEERIEELRSAWRAQARRVREIDGVLEGEERASSKTSPRDASKHTPKPRGTIEKYETSRQQNIEKLRTLRAQAHRDLMGTLAWVRELVTMIHLAKYTGAPAARAEELVAQVAAAVEGLSEVSRWEEDSSAPSEPSPVGSRS